jgi:hypothetical protein
LCNSFFFQRLSITSHLHLPLSSHPHTPATHTPAAPPTPLHPHPPSRQQDCSKFDAYGRIISGTLRPGDRVRVLGEAYTPEDEEDSGVEEVTGLWAYQARYRWAGKGGGSPWLPCCLWWMGGPWHMVVVGQGARH